MIFKELILGSNWNTIEYKLNEIRTYLFSLVFILASVALPYLAHQFQMGGRIFLPIYFFILIGSYKYGWKFGAIVSISAVLANYLLLGMPPANLIPIIMTKAVVLALSAALIASKTSKISLIHITSAVVGYQIIGTLVEFVITRNIVASLTDVIIGYPGLLLQIFGGYFLLRLLYKNDSKINAGNIGKNQEF